MPEDEKQLTRVCPAYQLPCEEARQNLAILNQECAWKCTITRVEAKEVLGHVKQEETTVEACKLDALIEGTKSVIIGQQQIIAILMAMAQSQPRTQPFPPPKMRGN